MAKEVIELDVQTDSAQSVKSLKDLQKELKDLISQQANVKRGTKEFKDLAKQINDTEGEIGELMDSFKTLTGSGVDRLTSSTSLLREGFENFDTGKIKLGLSGIGQAMKAIPIFLIIEGVMKLIESFDELKEAGGIVGDVFTAIGDAIDWVGDRIEELIDWISDVDTEAKRFAENQIEDYKKMKEAVGERYDFEIAKASAAGKDTIALEKEKAIETRKSIDKQMQALIELGRIKGKLNNEEKKQLEELGKERVKALHDEELANIKFNKLIDEAIARQTEKEKEELNKRKENWKKHLDDIKKLRESQIDNERENLGRLTDEELAVQELKQQQELANEQFIIEMDKREEEREKEKIAKRKEEQDAIKAWHEEQMKMIEEAAYSQLQIAQNVSDALFTLEENRFTEDRNRITKSLQNKNLTDQQRYALELELFNKENELKKKKFQVDKAFQVAQATQDGIRSVLGALAQTSTLGAGSIALAATNAAIAATNIAKILATKFDGGVAPAPPDLTAGLNSNAATPQANTIPNVQATTTFDEQGRNTSLTRVVLVESDVTKSQNRVKMLEDQATIK